MVVKPIGLLIALACAGCENEVIIGGEGGSGALGSTIITTGGISNVGSSSVGSGSSSGTPFASEKSFEVSCKLECDCGNDPATDQSCIAKCLEEGKQSEQDAVAAGCGDEFDAAHACIAKYETCTVDSAGISVGIGSQCTSPFHQQQLCYQSGGGSQ